MRLDGNSYGNLATLKTMMDISGTGNDTELLQSLEMASRSIDAFCRRHFYITSETRQFRGKGSRLLLNTDLLSITTLTTLKSDRSTDKTWASTDYELFPLGDTVYPKEWIELSDDTTAGSFASGIRRGVQIAGMFGYGNGSSTTPYQSATTTNDGSFSASLFSSTGTPLSGSRDGSSDYIVAFYAESGSSDFPHPTTCGTVAWHDNQFADVDKSSLYYSSASEDVRENYKMLVACLNGFTSGYEFMGHPTVGQKLKIKVYDPTRDIVVSAKSHKVNINNGTASIGDTFDITWRGNNVIEGFITGSAVGGATQMIDGLLSGVSGPASGGACIKLDA